MKKSVVALTVLFVLSCFINAGGVTEILGVQVLPLRIVAIIGAVLWALRGFAVGRGSEGRAGALVLLMVVYGGVTISWSPNTYLGVRQLVIFCTGTLFYFGVRTLAEFDGVSQVLLDSWAAAIILCGVLGGIEVVRGEYLFAFDEYQLPAAERIARSIGWLCPRTFWPNWNNFAYVNALSAPVLIGSAFDSKGWRKTLACAGSVAAVLMIALTYSRAATFGFALSALLFILVVVMKHGASNLRRSMLGVFLLVSVVVLGVLYVGGSNTQRVFQALVTKQEMTDNSLRLHYYKVAVTEGTIGSAGFGRGFGSSAEIIEGGSYHHFMLEILAELGLWMFAFVCAVGIQLAWLQLKRNWFAQGRFLGAGLFAISIAFPVLCLGPSSVSAEGVTWLWLALLGMSGTQLNTT